jgi:capsular polysaccharide transport system permease protein
MRSRVNIILFLVLFILPLLGVVIYEFRIASNRYNSDASLIITQETGAMPTIDLTAFGLPSPSDSKDVLVAIEFIASADMLNYLDQQLQVRAHYSDSKLDWWSRLPASATMEDFRDYMASYIVPTYDATSNIIRIHVESFDREYSQKVVKLILERSQVFVDKLNNRVTTEQTRFFERQLGDSEQRLREVKQQLLKFQTENRLMTTDAEATMINANIAQIQTALLSKQADLATLTKQLNANSPVIQILQSEIEALNKQLVDERNRLSGGSSGAMSELDAQLREIQFNLEFVTGVYKSNLTQLETARIQAAQRLKYLIVVTTATIADESLYPNRPYVIGTAAMVLIMVFFIMSLLTAIIREHS